MPQQRDSRRQPPRVLIADDNPGIQAAVSQLLSPACDVVGCVSDIDALFEAMPQLQPDLVLLDLSLRGESNPFDVCRRIKAATPRVHVVAFTAHNDADLRAAATDAGASGYVWKVQADELLATIQTVLYGADASSETGAV